MCGSQDTAQHSAFTCLTQKCCLSVWLCSRVRGAVVCLGMQIHPRQKIQLSVLMAPARGKIHCNRLQLTAVCFNEQISPPRLGKAREGSLFVGFFLKKEEKQPWSTGVIEGAEIKKVAWKHGLKLHLLIIFIALTWPAIVLWRTASFSEKWPCTYPAWGVKAATSVFH